MFRTLFIAALFLIISSSLSAQQELKVVTSFPLLKDLAEKIGGDHVEVTSIIPAGVDPHHFEPNPDVISRLEKADLLIINGLGYEIWMDKILSSNRNNADLLVASTGVKPLIDLQGHVCEEGDHASHDSHGITNPHAWMNPKNTVIYLENITTKFSELRPEYAQEFQASFELSKAQINTLDSWIKFQMNRVPQSNRKLLTEHNSAQYFADAYGFEMMSLGNSLRNSEMTMKDFTEIKNWIDANSLNGLLIESNRDKTQYNQMKRDLALTSIQVFYVDQLPQQGSQDYISMMQKNTFAVLRTLDP